MNDMSDYVVIKLSGNWIEKEKNKKRIDFIFHDIPNVEVLENAAVTCTSAKLVMKEDLDRVGDNDRFKRYIKEHLSTELGYRLMEHGLITYDEKSGEMSGLGTTQISATVVVIKEGAENERAD